MTISVLDIFNIILGALNNVDRLSILLALSTTNEKSITEISNETGKSYRVLDRHFNRLKVANLIESRIIIEKGQSKRKRSLYQITDFGKYMIRSIIVGYKDYYNNGRIVEMKNYKRLITNFIQDEERNDKNIL